MEHGLRRRSAQCPRPGRPGSRARPAVRGSRRPCAAVQHCSCALPRNAAKSNRPTRKVTKNVTRYCQLSISRSPADNQGQGRCCDAKAWLRSPLVASGVEKFEFLDDRPYPFKPNAQFKAWLPLTHHANSWTTRRRSRCWSTTSPTTTGTPLTAPEGAWVDHFDIRVISDPADAAKHYLAAGAAPSSANPMPRCRASSPTTRRARWRSCTTTAPTRRPTSWP